VALTSKGGIATASSFLSNGMPDIAIDGIRNWATSGAWKDSTPDVYPDWLQVDFSGSKTINEIDIFAVRDDFTNTEDPTENTMFSQYGITDFVVEYWNGLNWTAVPNGVVSNNNKVITKLVFASITTTKIRVVVNNAQSNYSRIVELEAWSESGGSNTTPTPTPSITPSVTPTATPSPTPTVTPSPTPVRANVALASSGATASASTEFPGGYSPFNAINGSRTWAAGGGWKDATADQYPDFLQVDFNSNKTINEIDVYAVTDDFSSGVEPNEQTTFSLYGITSFEVQYWNGTSWMTVPNGVVTNNNKVITKLTFAPVTTNRIRVIVNNAQSSFSRIVELEAWGN
jgi:hypothetical protein